MDTLGLFLKDDFRFRPLAGLLSISKKELRDADIVASFSYIKKKLSSISEERIAQLSLLFYFINIIRKESLPFLVKGGILLQYYLSENARYTSDLDLITPYRAQDFYENLKIILDNYKGVFKFEIIKFEEQHPTKLYYYDTFNISIICKYQNKKYGEVFIDGVSSPIYKNLIGQKYCGPSFIEDDFIFNGLQVENIIAEKIIAVTGDLLRPYKHLVDLYGLINLDIDIRKLKDYLKLILDYENTVRNELGKESLSDNFIIKKDQKFSGSFILPTLQAGYKITFEEMKNAVNEWLNNNLK